MASGDAVLVLHSKKLRVGLWEMLLEAGQARFVSVKLQLPFESEREPDQAKWGGPADGRAEERATVQDKTPGSDKMLQCEPLSVIVGIRRVAQHAAGARTMEKLSGSCRPVPSPLRLPVT